MTITQNQRWEDFSRDVIVEEHSSVQIDFYDRPDRNGVQAMIFGLWVDKGYRRMGRARRLLEMAEMQARYRGFKHVFLFYGYNEAPRFVLDWYERSGYKRVSFNPEKKIVLLTKNLI